MRKKINRILKWAALFCVFAYLLTVGFIVSRYDSYSINGITYHFQGNKDMFQGNMDLIPQFDRKARALLQESEFKTLPTHLHVFLTANEFDFRVLGFPTGQGTFGLSRGLGQLFGFVAVAPTTGRNRVISRTDRHRRVSSVLAHELTHLLIKADLGWLNEIKLGTSASWIIEGYADYIAQESSFPTDPGMALFCDGKTDPSPSYAYFRYRKVVGYLLDSEGLSFRNLAANPPDYAEAEARAKQTICP